MHHVYQTYINKTNTERGVKVFNPKPVEPAGNKGHMVAACTVPKEKLYCKFCNTNNLHNTSACIKKQKEEEDKKGIKYG